MPSAKILVPLLSICYNTILLTLCENKVYCSSLVISGRKASSLNKVEITIQLLTATYNSLHLAFTTHRSEEREVLEVRSIPAAILPSCQYMKIVHYNCTDVDIVG